MTGASGAIYSLKLLNVLLSHGRDVHLTISEAAVQVFRQELNIDLDLQHFDPTPLLSIENRSPSGDNRPDSPAVRGRLTYAHYRDYFTGIASGSFLTGGMVICPCSMGTLGALAAGLSSNLIHRAADVHLKERRKLVVVPRETPLGSLQLQNMKILSDAGVVILPAMPGFYHRPTTIEDLVDFVVNRICDQLGVETRLSRRWGDNRKTNGSEPAAAEPVE
ncbi:UbiX family flavin prenyltransferase [Planctomicrobium sp. SH664]|uniref:UbiX family flavin prenyltransferase n=1 Tax=Planctomicrobium sp. SH664 TaxID=3448125 RepID=UPI003F5B49E3